MEIESPLTKEKFKQVLGLTAQKYSDTTQRQLYEILLLTERVTALVALKFLVKISHYNEEQVKHGISKFYAGEYHLKGYKFEWCAGMIRRENEFKSSQLKNKLPGLPRTK
jgi:hypothetical protein